MRCPRCGWKSFSQGTPLTTKNEPGHMEVLQRRVCSNPRCRHHFKVAIIKRADLPPDPPDAA